MARQHRVRLVTTATSPRPRIKPLFVALAALLACGGLTACQGETDIKASPATASASAAVPAGLESFYSQKVSWYACAKKGMAEATSGQDTGFTCAKVKVPLDYDNPGGETIEIAVKKRAASEDSVGSLFVNPGGPGGSGIELVESAGSYFSKSLTGSYDVVGFDPRGVGASSAVDCLTDAELDAERAGANDPATPSAAATQERAQKMGEACASKTSPVGLLDHIDTISAAKDLDILRAVDGQQALTYLGFSYGTYLGATYAELFPANTGRLVLDGAVDPSLSLGDRASGQAQGFETALRTYVQQCQSGQAVQEGQSCPLTGDADAGVQQVRTLISSADQTPLKTSDPNVTVDGSTIRSVVRRFLYTSEYWSFLTYALDQAITQKDGSYIQVLYGKATVGGSAPTFYAVNCLDIPVQGDMTSWEKEYQQILQSSPTFGASLGNQDARCQAWGHNGTRKPAPIHAKGAAPILVVGTTGDPATPYAWSQALADQLESGRLLTWEGNGHTAYGRAGACVQKAVDTYLTSGTVPKEGLTCKNGQ